MLRPYLLLMSLLLSFSAMAQVTDLKSIVLKHTGKEAYEMEDFRAEIISPEGHIAGTFLSTQDVNNRVPYVLIKNESGRYQPFVLTELPAARVAGFVGGANLVVNSAPAAVAEQKVLVFRWQGSDYAKNGKDYAPELVKLPFDQATVVSCQDSLLAVNAKLQDQRTDRELPANQYASDIPADFRRSTTCTRGMAYDLLTGLYAYTSFPMAIALNLDSEVAQVNLQGYACGASKGFAGRRYLEEYYPFYATPDSVYLVLIGTQGRAIAMNEAGLVCGSFYQPEMGKTMGFVWNFEERLNEREGWQVIRNNRPALPEAMNESGMIVGTDEIQAFVWKDNVFNYLDDIIDSSNPDLSKWNFRALHDINDAGLAVGEAEVDGNFVAVLVDLNQLDL